MSEVKILYELCHYGIKGMKWGVRRYQYSNGSLTPAGAARYRTNKTSKTQKYPTQYRLIEEGYNKKNGRLTDKGKAKYEQLINEYDLEKKAVDAIKLEYENARLYNKIQDLKKEGIPGAQRKNLIKKQETKKKKWQYAYDLVDRTWNETVNKYKNYEISRGNFDYNFATDAKEFLVNRLKQKYIFDNEEFRLIPR